MSRHAYGLRAWMWQRLSSVYMAIFLLAAGAFFLIRPPASHEEWRAWMSLTPVNLATGVFFWALLIHAWVGARDVLMDYVDPLVPRLILLSITGFVLAASGLWALKVLYSLLTTG